MSNHSVLTWRQKEILFKLVAQKVNERIPIPRGTGKSYVSIYIRNYNLAYKQTNYILEAIGETI